MRAAFSLLAPSSRSSSLNLSSLTLDPWFLAMSFVYPGDRGPKGRRSGRRGARGGDRELIGAVVERLVRVLGAGLVTLDPVPAHLGVAGDLGVERHDQVLVLDRRTRGRLPALLL